VQDYYYTDIGVDEDPTSREKAYTTTGREVFGGGGITPDVRVEGTKNTKFMDLLNSEYMFFNFAKRFTSDDERKLQASESVPDVHGKLQVINKKFDVDDKVVEDFRDFVKKAKIEFTDQDFEENLPQIKVQIRQEIFNAIWGSEEGYKVAAANDPQIQKALELIPKAEALLKTRKEKMANLVHQNR
jgi:carboxyl-terminal processing protease